MTRSKIIGEFAMTDGGRPDGWRSLWAAFPALVFSLFIQLYRWTISPALTFMFGATSGCRFTPTCSQYAREAMERHGALTGSVLAVKRICRCHPFGGCGHDPVPAQDSNLKSSPSPLPSPAGRGRMAVRWFGILTITSTHRPGACPKLEGKASHG